MRILTPIFTFFTLLLMLLVVGCGGDDNNIDNMSEAGSSPLVVSWHAMEQSERNSRILEVALDYYGNNVELSCKEWVRDVIEEATNGHVKVPSNTPAGDSWGPDPESHIIRYRYNSEPAILDTTPGDIVQMQWKPGIGSSDSEYNMHTAIVLSVFQNGVIFIESNYDKTPEDVSDAVVSIRFESEQKFNQKVQAFSVYSVR